MKYSPSTGGFYPETATGMPGDAVEVTDEAYAALFAAQAAGQVIVAGPGGAPIAQAPAAPTLTLAQQAYAALFAGMTITLSGSMTLTATLFPVDPPMQLKLNGVISLVNTTGGFPGGASSYPLKDASGAWHSFTLPQYKAVAAAIADYVAALDLIADGNPLSASALPAASVSLTL